MLKFKENTLDYLIDHVEEMKDLKPKVHKLKTWVEPFKAMKLGLKDFEVRFNDRDFKVGDILELYEYDQKKNKMTGDNLTKRIKYILKGGQFGIQKDFVVLGLMDAEECPF